MLFFIIIAVVVIAFITCCIGASPKQQSHRSKDPDIEPIFDDGEIVGWYEEERK